MEPFLDALKKRVLVGDGAYGTLFSRRGLSTPGLVSPLLNLAKPGFVKAIHEEYLRAGADVIETNTFGASRPVLEAAGMGERARDVWVKGAQIARDAANGKAWVLGSIGPLGRVGLKLTPEERQAAYAEQARGLAEGGVDAILFETFSDLEDISLAIAGGKEAAPSTPLMAQMAFSIAGTTTSGVSPETMLDALTKLRIDVIGANCGGGESAAIEVIRRIAQRTSMPISVYPNRGLADFDENGRPIYIEGADYFAKSARRLADLGANLIGGCCGTGPEEIKKLKVLLAGRLVSARHPAAASSGKRAAVRHATLKVQKTLGVELARGGVVVAEIDPPRGVDATEQLEGAKKVTAAGVDAITIADNALSVMRMGNLALAQLFMRELNARIILHVACRDRSLMGTQSHLLAAYAMGISNILAVTGDPIATQAHQGSSGVFDMSSTKLIELISRINRGEFTAEADGDLRTNFYIGAAFNSATRSLENETKRLERKKQAGAGFVMTQPVFSVEAARAVANTIAPLNMPVLLGVMPLVSERNAEFLHNEVPGIQIPESVRARMAGKSGKAGRAEGMAIAREMMEQVSEQVAGFYLITPFDRYDMIAELAKAAKSLRVKARA